MQGCNENCNEITQGRWSGVGPVPVALVGAVCYAVMLVSAGLLAVGLLAFNAVVPSAYTLLLATSTAAIGAAAWFTFLQAVILRKFCLYCCGVD